MKSTERQILSTEIGDYIKSGIFHRKEEYYEPHPP